MRCRQSTRLRSHHELLWTLYSRFFAQIDDELAWRMELMCVGCESLHLIIAKARQCNNVGKKGKSYSFSYNIQTLYFIKGMKEKTLIHTRIPANIAPVCRKAMEVLRIFLPHCHQLVLCTPPPVLRI